VGAGKLIYLKGVISSNLMNGIGFLVAVLSVISIVLSSAYPLASMALTTPSSAHFSPIVPFFTSPQNTSNATGPGEAAALQGPLPPELQAAIAKALQSPANATGPPPTALQAAIAKALQSPANATTTASNTPTAAGFLSKGTINSLIRTPTSNWIATGNWSMTVDNGSLTGFMTNMTWFNSNGKASHTHEFSNLRGGGGTMNGNNIVINGLMDVGTNHRVVWKNVPTTISIQGGKTMTISVDDSATNHHFAGQPVFGLVTSFIPCSDIPGANMEVLPSCQK
jgi:hypothetical protein